MLTIVKPIGATLCLLLGRYFFFSLAARLVAGNEDFRGLMKAVERKPWKLLLLLRLAMLPGVLKNYGVALIDAVQPHTFFLCVLIGDLPYTLLWSFVGSRGSSLTEVLGGKVEKTPGQSALSLLGTCTRSKAFPFLSFQSINHQPYEGYRRNETITHPPTHPPTHLLL